MTAVVRGEVAAVFTGLVGAYPLAKSGRLRVLAVTTAQRSPLAPDIPTISESGFKGYEATTWYGAMVPTGTSNAIVARLHDDSVKAIRQPETLERLAAAGIDPIGNTPEEFAAYIRSEIDKWGKLVKISGARPD
jgi:tripartite-type tricarboxylate transporter receptor subunit TctC